MSLSESISFLCNHMFIFRLIKSVKVSGSLAVIAQKL